MRPTPSPPSAFCQRSSVAASVLGFMAHSVSKVHRSSVLSHWNNDAARAAQLGQDFLPSGTALLQFVVCKYVKAGTLQAPLQMADKPTLCFPTIAEEHITDLRLRASDIASVPLRSLKIFSSKVAISTRFIAPTHG